MSVTPFTEGRCGCEREPLLTRISLEEESRAEDMLRSQIPFAYHPNINIILEESSQLTHSDRPMTSACILVSLVRMLEAQHQPSAPPMSRSRRSVEGLT